MFETFLPQIHPSLKHNLQETILYTIFPFSNTKWVQGINLGCCLVCSLDKRLWPGFHFLNFFFKFKNKIKFDQIWPNPYFHQIWSNLVKICFFFFKMEKNNFFSRCFNMERNRNLNITTFCQGCSYKSKENLKLKTFCQSCWHRKILKC